ncbi:nucleoside triphosphate pyrophosphohydrolase family protein [Tritonibacter scottomollicae]|uniref:Nucleoside triphosphate pyrophosphohydrolase family protein n=1 Tax=Tritonibacter scottomollicae TaxID=483013 RepID=A0ABZ0HIE0_TRISK|nr:nucleoside triphosphate pyrophosphohydrolase family protein [Tritonibacter scottomollicae]WOI33993.1 nucleoside triphosphate pyrophosphohydrolase family protein [Tritonibacter scottomollicae]
MSGSPVSPHVLLSDYEQAIAATDRFEDLEVTPILLGLFGEVGSVMSTSKKLHREKGAFTGFRRDVEEELGDTLWYVAALCRRLDVKLSDMFARVLDGKGYAVSIAANADPAHPVARIMTAKDIAPLDFVLLRLGEQAAKLLSLDVTADTAKDQVLDFVRVYIEAVQAAHVSFSTVLSSNMAKACGRFIAPNSDDLPDFDSGFPVEEQLPRQFEIEISQRANSRSYLRWNGVFIGDPLSDNISDEDGYRFHDVFHFANAAILHWSPTFRALIKHKRKSKKHVDEAQDSGRAIVIDEGLSAYIFSYAKSVNFFEDQKTVSFDLLKAVRNFVRGYEVEACPLHLWEYAILQGYKVFREVRRNNGGIIVGNRDERTLRYKPAGK